MTEYFVAPIVEGHGEVQAVPALLHRIRLEVQPDAVLKINPPIRVKASSFLRDAEYLAKHVRLATLKAQTHQHGSVLILLDCEDNCPGILGPRLLALAQSVHHSVSITVALAHREYETWFIAAAQSLRGVAGLSKELETPADPERLRDAKGWLNLRMSTSYNPPDHQLLMTKAFSFAEAARVQSFARTYTKLRAIFSA